MGVLRPDEKASRSQSEANKSFDSKLKTGAGLALSAGIGAAAGATGLAAKIVPFLSKYIPVDLAVKGINKFSPKLGKILKQGQSMGLDVAEGLEFVKNKMNAPEKNRQAALKKFNEKKSKGKGVVADLEERFQQEYGQPQWNMPAPQQPAPQTPQPQPAPQMAQQQQPQQAQAQPNNTDAALLAAFQKILQM